MHCASCREEARNFLRTIQKRKVNWISHILSENCLLKHIIERKIGGGIEVTRRRGERHKQLLDTFRKREGTGN